MGGTAPARVVRSLSCQIPPAAMSSSWTYLSVPMKKTCWLSMMLSRKPSRGVPAIGKGGHPVPLTLTTTGPFGSLLTIVSVAAADPRWVGWNRIGTAMESPPSTVRGKLTTWGVTKIGPDEMMPVTLSGHGLLLLMTRSRSVNLPRRTSPKSPLSGTTTVSLGAGAAPNTTTVLGPVGSLLWTVIVAASGPNAAGAKRIGSSYVSPGAIVSGSAAIHATAHVARFDTIDVTVSGHAPEFVSISSLSRWSPRQASPRSPPGGVETSSSGAPALAD